MICSRPRSPIPGKWAPRASCSTSALSANLALFDTNSHNGYFFFYDSTTSTQNLGNLDALYKGGELELTAKATDRLDLYANFGYNDGSITAMQDPTVIGNKPPLLTQDTVNAGFQCA